MLYTFARTYIGILFTSAAAAVMGASGDEEEKKKLFKEMEDMGFMERQMFKIKKSLKNANERNLNTLLNATLSSAIDPQTSFTIRSLGGLVMFYTWKQGAVTEMMDEKYSKEDRKRMKQAIRDNEAFFFELYNIKSTELFGTDEYSEAIKRFYGAGEEVRAWEEFVGSVSGFQALLDVANSTKVTYDLYKASEENPDLSKTEIHISALMQGYGLIFSNFVFGAKIGPLLSMFSGDFTKFGKAMMKDQQQKQKQFEYEGAKGYMMYIEKGKRGSSRRGGSNRGGGGRGSSKRGGGGR
jgi:hypothetical protein